MGVKERVSHPLKMVKDENSKILILGSFPSVKSREKNFFYMNKYNRFYQVLTKLFGEDFYSCSIEEKINLLRKYHISIYDVVIECEIINSSDSSISPIRYIDLEKTLENTKINKIFLNGNKAYSLFVKKYPSYIEKVIKLPSTSSANAKMSLNDLVQQWKVIKDYL